MRFVLITITSLCAALAHAQEVPAEGDSVAIFKAEAADYTFRSADKKEIFDFQSTPLLHWSNPARNGEDGAVFLWTNHRVPKVIGTCFTYTYSGRRNRKHAFHVLTEQAIVGAHRDSTMWSPAEKSFVMQVLPDAPAPAATETQRTIQMRNLARRYRVEATLKNGVEHCRFVPQPLYRYASDEKTAENATSGAIFSFSIGTDPEALLLFETRTNDEGKLVWHYGFARFTFYELEGYLDDRSIWKADASENLLQSILQRGDYQRLPYITFRAEHLLDR